MITSLCYLHSFLIRFEYDGNGNLLVCVNESVRVERKFDLDGLLVEEHQGENFVIKNEYDQNGNRISRVTETKTGEGIQEHTVNFGYNSLGQAVDIEIPGHDPIKLTRNALGRVTQEALSGNVKRFIDYTDEGYIKEQAVLGAEGLLFQQESTSMTAPETYSKRPIPS